MSAINSKALLLSIQPRYAEAIFKGHKTVELRRTRPNLNPGDLVIMYITAPVAEIQGAFQVASIQEHSMTKLWDQFKKEAAIKKDDFKQYFLGLRKGYCIHIENVQQLDSPTNLENMKRIHRIIPPQGYRYLDRKAVKKLKIKL